MRIKTALGIASSAMWIGRVRNQTGVIYKSDIDDMKKFIEKFSKEVWDIHSLLLKNTKEIWLKKQVENYV